MKRIEVPDFDYIAFKLDVQDYALKILARERKKMVAEAGRALVKATFEKILEESEAGKELTSSMKTLCRRAYLLIRRESKTFIGDA